MLLVDYGGDDPRALLSDFGIAPADDIDHFAAEGVTTGTAAYLSPDQAAGGGGASRRDLVSLLRQTTIAGSSRPKDAIDEAVSLEPLRDD